MSYDQTAEFQVCKPDTAVKNAVRNEAYRLFGGPIMDTSVEKTLAVCIAAGALDEKRLAALLQVKETTE